MELCSIRDNQRAQLSQLIAREVAAMIKVCYLFIVLIELLL